MNLDVIRKLDRAIEPSESVIADEREGMGELLKRAKKEDGIRPDAFKSARKLKKLKDQDRRAWLLTFHATIDALGLDAQIDLEDAIANAEAKPAVKAAREFVDSVRGMGADVSFTGPDGSGVKITADAVQSIPPATAIPARERTARGKGTLN